ncbi:MAG: nickel-dependent hydrogenase large subunit, partial [Thiohalomonadales bacterium]|nr:nickel-dependent hydrogenase large subunit [Thiohalomonadales bacterium]
MTQPRDISIKVPVLSRVEGEGALQLQVKNGAIEDLQLRIYEPPRLFEKMLEGREPNDVIDIVARICGICPVAYQMTAVHALENLCEVEVTPWVRAMRRVFYCGEWLQSHALHIHMLAAPDFLGFNNIIEMATKDAAVVRRGLRIQALGNDLIELFGARSVHPVGARVGGFYHAPATTAVEPLVARLKAAKQDADNLVCWTASLSFPKQEQEFVAVALQHADEYPMNGGRIVSSSGLDIDCQEYLQYFQEHQVPHSTALHALLDNRPYLVGPLARINLNTNHLPHELTQLLTRCGITFPSHNMFHSIVARAVECWLAIDEALLLLQDYERPAQAALPWQAHAGSSSMATEAPRGLLWHHY